MQGPQVTRCSLHTRGKPAPGMVRAAGAVEQAFDGARRTGFHLMEPAEAGVASRSGYCPLWRSAFQFHWRNCRVTRKIRLYRTGAAIGNGLLKKGFRAGLRYDGHLATAHHNQRLRAAKDWRA